MPSTSESTFESDITDPTLQNRRPLRPDNIDPATNLALRYNEDGAYTWDHFSALRREYGIMYHDQNEGGPALIGLPIPHLWHTTVVRPGPTVDPKALYIALCKAIVADPVAFSTIDSLVADLKALGVVVRGVGHDLLGDINDCRRFTAKLMRVRELEPLEAMYYPHALMEARAKYNSLYLIDVYPAADGRYMNAADHRKTAGLSTTASNDPLAKASLIDTLQRKITLKLLAPIIAKGGCYQPPIWRIMDQPLPPAPATAA